MIDRDKRNLATTYRGFISHGCKNIEFNFRVTSLELGSLL
jgi:hypothetical protein